MKDNSESVAPSMLLYLYFFFFFFILRTSLLVINMHKDKIDIEIILDNRKKANYNVQVPSLELSVRQLREMMDSQCNIEFEFKFITLKKYYFFFLPLLFCINSFFTFRNSLTMKQETGVMVREICDVEKKRITIRKMKNW